MKTADLARSTARNARNNRALAFAAAALAVMVLGLNVVVWLVPSITAHVIAEAAGPEATLTGGARLVVFVYSMIQGGFLAGALLAAAALFRAFATGGSLVPRTGRLVRRFGLCLLIYSLLGLLSKTVVVAAATWNNPSGERVLTIGVSSEMLVFLIVAGVILALGHVMQEAARIADDHRQIV